jgi:hypothetical protein
VTDAAGLSPPPPARRPGTAATKQSPNTRRVGVSPGIVPQHGVKDLALAIVQHEGHRVFFPSTFDFAFATTWMGYHQPGRCRAHRACRTASGPRDGMIRIGDLDSEGAMGVMAAELRIPDPSGQTNELGPFVAVPGTAGKMVRPGPFQQLPHSSSSPAPRRRGPHFPIHEVQDDHVPVLQPGRRGGGFSTMRTLRRSSASRIVFRAGAVWRQGCPG